MQVELTHRLGEAGLHARFTGSLAMVADGGQHYERQLRQCEICLDGRGELDSAHPGHLHVDNGEVVRLSLAVCVAKNVERGRSTAGHVYAESPVLELTLKHNAIGLVVIHDEGAHAVEFGNDGRNNLGGDGLLLQRDDEPEGAALALFTLYANLSLHEMDELLAD